MGGSARKRRRKAALLIRRKKHNVAGETAVEKPLGGKVPNQTFPPSLQIAQKARDSHFPTAETTAGLRLHFQCLDGGSQSYILKWLDTRTGTHVWEQRQHWPYLACRSAFFCRIISTRLAKSCRRSRPYLVRVATSSRLWESCGSARFSRNSLRMGCTLAKIRNISPLNAGSRKSSSFSTPFRTNEAVIPQ